MHRSGPTTPCDLVHARSHPRLRGDIQPHHPGRSGRGTVERAMGARHRQARHGLAGMRQIHRRAITPTTIAPMIERLTGGLAHEDASARENHACLRVPL